MAQLDSDLPRWEAERGALEQALAGAGADYGRLEELTRALAALNSQLGIAEERWLELSELAE